MSDVSEYTVTYRGRRYGVSYCGTCWAGEHARQACLLCRTDFGVFDCQRIDHLAAYHPKALEQLNNDPDPLGLEVAKAEAVKHGPAYLGSMRIPDETDIRSRRR